MTTANDIKAIEDKFVGALGSGTSAARHLLAMTESVVTSRDTTVLARSIVRAEAKGDKAASGVIKFIIRTVWAGAKMKAPKAEGAAPSIIIKGIDADSDVMARFREAVNDKAYSIRATTFRKHIAGESKDKPEFDPKKRAESFAKSHDKAEVEAFIAALQAAVRQA